MLRSAALVFFVLFWALPARAAEPSVPAGRVDFVVGDTWFIDASQQRRRPLQGDFLLVTDTISTGADGEVHLDMEDGAYLAIRSNTLLKIEEYRARGDESDRGTLNLIKGTFRSFTGWIARLGPKAYLTKTVTSTIGIRGTDHEPLFIPEGSSLGEPGTYDKVNEGATFIDHASGRIEVTPNKVGFAPLIAGAAARLLQRVPDFFRPSANENLLVGRHKLVQERMQERLDARRRLNQSKPPESQPNSGTSSELQETPLEPDTSAIGDAPVPATSPNVPPVPPSATTPGVPVTPSATTPGVPVPPPATTPGVPVTPSATTPGVPVAPATAVRSAPVAPPATAVPRVPAVSPTTVVPGVSPVSPATALPTTPKVSPPAAVPSVPKTRSSTAVPGAAETTRPVTEPPRVAPETGRSESEVQRLRPESVKSPAEDRTKVFNERRRQQQEDRRRQFERDRELGRKRDGN
ncbi:MAG TPA: hypothetical protein VJT81_08305 [Burkholderiales bacterium]|nr:hypothetical protein [Burkholderiales bacterium]